MKKTMVRIFAAVLVLAMAIGFLAMIPASATVIDETASVQFFSNNVQYEDCMKLMYAVYNPQNEAYTIKLSANGEACEILEVAKDVEIHGTTCTTYVSKYGVPLQNIETVITAELYVGDELKDTCTYSVLEYLHEMQTIIGGGFRDEDLSAEARAAMLNMYNSLLESAASIQTVLSGSSTIGNYGYVYLTNGTINGKQGALLNVGATITADDLAVEGVATSWQYKTVGGEFAALPEEGLTIANNNYILTAEIDGDVDPSEPDYSGRYYIATNRTTGNYFYMTSDLGSASTKRYQAVDSGLSELPEKITGTSDGYVFVLEANEDGTYYIYAESSDSANYLGWSSGNSGILVEKGSAKTLTVDKTDDGLYNIHFAASATEERYLSLNGTTNNNYFAWYAGTQRQDLALIPIEECEHTNDDGVIIAPTCTESGYTAYTCTKCGFITKTDEVAATGHTYNSEVTQEATCTVAGVTTYTCSVCDDSYTEEIEALGHNYVAGVCERCKETESGQGGEPAETQEATLDLNNAANRTAFSTTQQIWSANGITLTNNKDASTSNVANYTPPRLYAKSQTIIECADGKITQIVFTCSSSSYATAMVNSCNTVDGATATASGSVVTVVFDEPVDSFTITMSAQVRMGASVVVTYIPE